MSNDATRMYSTCFSPVPLGYCDFSLFEDRESTFTRLGAERDECCEDGASDSVLDLELFVGSDVRSESVGGG